MERVPGDGWKEALDLFTTQRDDLFAGRKPHENSDGLTIMGLCNRFLTFKQHQFEIGEIVWLTFTDYKIVTDRLIAVLGKTRLVEDLAAKDFEELRANIAKTEDHDLDGE